MVKIKICGIKTIKDIEIVNKYLPDYIGFVFAESRQKISDDTAQQLKKALVPEIKAVGVFVNDDISHIISLVEQNIIDVIQLHGDESEEYIAQLKKAVSVPVNKVFKVKDKELAEPLTIADYVLLDSSTGGSGKTFDLNNISNIESSFFVAGGINITNVQQYLNLEPYGIDVSSGVEVNGEKDEHKIKELIEYVRIHGVNGRYGEFGGQFVGETLMNAVIELEDAFNRMSHNPEFLKEFHDLLNNYANRPSLLYYAKNMTEKLGGAKVYLKREDLNHTGSHKINNAIGQILLAKKMGKTRVIAETGAGQHGVATATIAALLGLECEIFMGLEDIERQKLNVFRMKLLGAKVHAVTSGTAVLKDAVNEALREWTTRVNDTLYIIGSAVGPHPYPKMVKFFQSVISKEIKTQILALEGRLPDKVIACVGGGSNSIGTFADFIKNPEVELIGCEAAGKGINTEEHAATLTKGVPGIFHGMKSYFCQTNDGQISPVYSISAGLDYPGVGPEHSFLHSVKRAKYVPITDAEAVEAFEFLPLTEGIIPAIESSHAVAYAMKLAPTLPKEQIIVVCLSGRGDKDVAMVAKYKGEDINE